jgi:hypothetical protein
MHPTHPCKKATGDWNVCNAQKNPHQQDRAEAGPWQFKDSEDWEMTC